MPDILERLVSQLKAKGMPEGQAYATATKTLQKSGSLKPGTQELTSKGKSSSKMGAAGRAKDRAVKDSGQIGRKATDYKYNQLNNTARLRGK
jgi:hypothetical protein